MDTPGGSSSARQKLSDGKTSLRTARTGPHVSDIWRRGIRGRLSAGLSYQRGKVLLFWPVPLTETGRTGYWNSGERLNENNHAADRFPRPGIPTRERMAFWRPDGFPERSSDDSSRSDPGVPCPI